MMKRRPPLLPLAALTLLACTNAGYEAPGVLDPSRALDLEINTQGTILADGVSTVDLLVKVDPLTPASAVITVETSSGVLDPKADPQSAEARKIDLKNPGGGSIPLSLRVGTTPGETLITAKAGDFQVQRKLSLTPLKPAGLVLTASAATAPADGSTSIDVRAGLFAEDSYHQVSQGARVRFRACCAGDDDNAPIDCDASMLLSLPAQADLTQGQEVAVKAIAQRITSGDPRKLWLLAQVWDARQGPLSCAPPEDGAVRDLAPLTLDPVPP